MLLMKSQQNMLQWNLYQIQYPFKVGLQITSSNIILYIKFLYIVDPCTKVHCGAGRVCQAKGTTASCVCIPQCPEELDPRRKVCTNRNETWSSDCEVYRHRCLCDTNDASCKGKDLKHIHINYYGECKSMPVRLVCLPIFSLINKLYIYFRIVVKMR